ncbi:MAG: arsenical pump rane protein [Ilumatobacteraceae bacterium]|nr:arsenical pump rane protein [Ilumatobacteraceae bacterium]
MQRVVRPEIVTAACAIAAFFAPANLTGNPAIDAAERVLIAAFVTYVGSHGRRWAWLAATAAVVVPAREASLLIAIGALLVIVLSAIPERRQRGWGAVGLGLMVNAVFWYPEGTPVWGVAVAVAAMVLVVGSGIPNLRQPKRRVAKGIVIGAVVLTLLAGLAAVAALGLSYRNVKDGSSAARSALDSARGGDAEGATAELATSRAEFEQASDRISGPLALPAAFVPGLAQQVSAVQTTVDQGTTIAATADDLVATADYDRLTYEGRLDVDAVRTLAAPTARADTALKDARTELAELQDGSLLPPLQDRIDQFAGDIEEARSDTALASELLEVTPGLFGADGPRRYLIIFVTPAELRGAGGFIGSYAELSIDDGKAVLTRSGRIDDLLEGPNQGKRTLTGPADYLERYGRFDPGDFLQDATQSPHFPSSASVIAQLYPQAGGVPVDGVISVDPSGLAALLELTGPVSVSGLDEPLSADNAVDILTTRQYLELGDRAARGEVLAEATKLTFEKLVESSLPAPRTLADTLSPAVRAGHLRLWSPERGEQAAFERLGATGDLEIPTGSDGLSVVQQNSGNNKIDAYLHRTITYLPKIDASTGELTAELSIELRNDVPFAELPGAVVGNTRGVPLGTNLAALSVFTPHQVTEATIDGEQVTLGPGSERGLNAWDTPLLEIPPGGSVTVTMKLVGAVDLTHGYQLVILPQPVANPDRFASTLTVSRGTIRGSGAKEKRLVDDEPLVAPTRFRVPVQH